MAMFTDIKATRDLLSSHETGQPYKPEVTNDKQCEPIQRQFLTQYRYPICKRLLLFHQNLAHLNRERCSKFRYLAPLTSLGKYGKLSRKIAFTLRISREEGKSKNVP